MKRTKKDIYKEFGIEYKNDKILTPFGAWIPVLLPIGTNTKIGNAATWSILHGNETFTADMVGDKCKAVFDAAGITEIKGSCPCHCKGCYCDNGRYNFDSVKAGNLLKLVIARMYPDFMVNAINAQIKADSITQLRIHASGDFFGTVYVDAWKAIIKANSGVTFWTYTKYEYALTAFETLPNISIVPSITPLGLNFGTCAELLEMHSALTAMGYRVHICACGTPFEKHCSDCKTGCKAIEKTCDFVLFIKHSTRDYKAGKHDSAAYNAVIDIIKAQDN